ncbi:hypothetical protein CRUP_029976 [Coryphaenoides rupestris]|nr:hypothetical protein CRUP_029976 [Coryphaenoides rupestris]
MAASWTLWIPLLAFASAVLECGVAPLNTKVVGGQTARPGTWPWQISLFIGTATVPMFHTCGGTLLNTQWVLTAANCIQLNSPSAYKVFIGRTTQNGPNLNEVVRDVSQIIIHPNFTSNSNVQNNDVALLQLSAPVEYTTFIRPICLASKLSTFSNASCYMTGWGKLSMTDPTISNVLHEVLVPLVDRGQCQSQFQGLGVVISSAMICAGELGKGICQNSVWIQLGLVSFGDLCATGKPDVYTRVPSYQNWIIRELAKVGGPVSVANVNFVTYTTGSTVQAGAGNTSMATSGVGVHHCMLIYPLLFLLRVLLG